VAAVTMMGQNDKKEQDLSSLAAKLQVIPRADCSSVLFGAKISLVVFVCAFACVLVLVLVLVLVHVHMHV
jgi:hypothetical protein